MTIWTASFWKATAERVVSSFAQGVLAGGVVGVLPVTEVPWWAALAMGGSVAALSLLKCLAAAGTGNGPSLTNAEKLP